MFTQTQRVITVLISFIIANNLLIENNIVSWQRQKKGGSYEPPFNNYYTPNTGGN